jgi:L-alanine-DL-glutamate epimerase-like enolase superfamily enzyme
MGNPGSAIARVEAWATSYPLASPLQFGDLRIDRRHYVVARIATKDGVEGVAYGLSRGAPIDLVVTDLLGPLLLGQDALDIPRIVERCRQAMVPLGLAGLVQRGLSLVDIALWDIKARSARLPLWRLLGGYRSTAPLMLVDGYARENETAADFAKRLLVRVQEGYTAIKLANQANPDEMSARLTAVRDAVGPGVALVLDIVWAWRDVQPAIDIARRWAPARLAWIEDPFPPDFVSQTRRLKAAIETPIGAGDEVSSPSVFDALLGQEAIDLVRLDATTIGGITGFAQVHSRAAAGGYRVSPHIYPEVHQHCAFAWPSVEPVEMFPSGSPFDFSHQFVKEGALEFETPGRLLAPTRDGIGLEIDWRSIEDHLSRHSVAQ